MKTKIPRHHHNGEHLNPFQGMMLAVAVGTLMWWGILTLAAMLLF